MSTHVLPDSAPVQGQPDPALTSQHPKLVLAGNPNIGKSVLFQALCGVYADVSNFPGTTVDLTRSEFTLGTFQNPVKTTLIDSPGVYGLSRFNDEERVAESAIMSADLVINVIAAPTLERDLFLTQQLIDFGLPLIIALNQMDALAQSGRTIDIEQLSKRLNVPIIAITATENAGIETLKEAIAQALRQKPKGRAMPGVIANQQTLETEGSSDQLKIYGLRRQYLSQITQAVLSQSAQGQTQGNALGKHLGRWLLNPAIGAMAMILVLLALYQVVGVWIAGDLVNFLESTVMLGWLVPFLQNTIGAVISQDSLVYQILAGEFGVVTLSFQYIVGVLFPLVLGFYAYLSILEDCGYLPRLAVLMDGLLSRVGLNGRAIIPMILGLGCVTMATVSTRMLNSSRERTIAAALLAITIPCSAQLGVIMGLMAVAGGLRGWLLFLGVLAGVFGLMGTVLNLILPGQSSAMIMDLPPIRLPKLKNVAQKTWIRTKGFVLEAAPIFAIGSLAVSLLHATGGLALAQKWLEPVTMGMLKLPAETAQVFVMGMVRRDFGVAGLYALSKQMSALQVLTCLITITLFVPCLASAAVLWKERGRLEAAAILAGSWAGAFLVGALVAHLGALLSLI
ncbi:MAG: ferrous iron transport protein B [Vampirovibrionales bacterium]|nr:ferrous iron transport protein B [Vampirovibrionales bacterium]